MEYKVGDIYTEKLTKLIGFDGEGKVVTTQIKRKWKVVAVDYDLNQIKCKTDNEYKIFEIK